MELPGDGGSGEVEDGDGGAGRQHVVARRRALCRLDRDPTEPSLDWCASAGIYAPVWPGWTPLGLVGLLSHLVG
jgi:hypothetical protein